MLFSAHLPSPKYHKDPQQSVVPVTPFSLVQVARAFNGTGGICSDLGSYPGLKFMVQDPFSSQ